MKSFLLRLIAEFPNSTGQKINYREASSFSCGSIAGCPSCCQQRPPFFTRREHIVPFLVVAPQKYVFSSDCVSAISDFRLTATAGCGVNDAFVSSVFSAVERLPQAKLARGFLFEPLGSSFLRLLTAMKYLIVFPVFENNFRLHKARIITQFQAAPIWLDREFHIRSRKNRRNVHFSKNFVRRRQFFHRIGNNIWAYKA